MKDVNPISTNPKSINSRGYAFKPLLRLSHEGIKPNHFEVRL